MARYVHLFDTLNEYKSARALNYKEPWFSYTRETSGVSYDKTEEEKMKEGPLTFEILSGGSIWWKVQSFPIDEYELAARTLEYSRDNGNTWTSITSSPNRLSGFTVSTAEGEAVNDFFVPDGFDYTTDRYKYSGNTMMLYCGANEFFIQEWDEPLYDESGNQYVLDSGSMVWYNPALIEVASGEKIMLRGDNTNFGYFDSTESYYYNFFSGDSACRFNVYGNIMSLLDSTGYTTASTLESAYTFYQLFSDCDGLVSAKDLVLPATTLVLGCYYGMFTNCTSLTTAPELPAITLADACYNNIFTNCTSLTTAPELPATTLASGCYYGMFNGCTGLTSAPELPATTLAANCYGSMFSGCTSLTAAPELPAITLADYCYSTMFNGCTSLTTAPELPATTLSSRCYHYMFNGCTGLTTAPVLPATTLASYCYQGMFNGCTSLVTAPELPATNLAGFCYQYMFNNCTSLTQAPELPAEIVITSCYHYMFKGCTSLTTAPELPATELKQNCYNSMFNGCTSLNYIKCLATDISANNCTTGWVDRVASTGTFVKNANMSSWGSGRNGIPANWTVTDAE